MTVIINWAIRISPVAVKIRQARFLNKFPDVLAEVRAEHFTDPWIETWASAALLQELLHHMPSRYAVLYVMAYEKELAKGRWQLFV